MKRLSDKAKQFFAFMVKIIIVTLALYFIYRKLSSETWLNWEDFKQLFYTPQAMFFLISAFLLAFLNRFFEILKWRNLAQTLRNTSIFQASQQVLSAMVFSIFTPNGIGEYGAKALFFDKLQAKRVVFLNFVCNGIQMIITIITGFIGLLILGYFGWVMGLIVVSGILWLLLMISKKMTIKGYSIVRLFDEIRRLPHSLHRKNIVLGSFRYLFFSTQQYLLLIFLGAEAPFLEVFGTIMAVYLLASCLPNFQFFDFMVKGGVSVYFFGLIGVNQWIVMVTTLMMWGLNVVLPVLIGAVLVLIYPVRFYSAKQTI